MKPSTMGLQQFTKAAIVFTGLSILAACNGTPAPVVYLDANHPNLERIDTACIAQVNEQQQALEQADTSQYLLLANTASHCIKDISFAPQHPDVQTAMQFNALAFVNYVKAGDMQAANDSLSFFRQTFPQQDLFFDDFSSFVDTATALVKQDSLSQQQMSLLNINPQLRAEIRRQREWSLN